MTKRTLKLNDLVNMNLNPAGLASYQWKSCKAKLSLNRNLKSYSPSLEVKKKGKLSLGHLNSTFSDSPIDNLNRDIENIAEE